MLYVALLVARGVAAAFLPRIGQVFADKGVEMRCCPEARALLAGVQCTGAESSADGLVEDALLIVVARELLCEAVTRGAVEKVANGGLGRREGSGRRCLIGR